MNKKVIYTCITNGYDNLIEPKIKTEDFDYICFTDSNNLKSNIWEIRKMPNECLKYQKNKIDRSVKILPHKYLQKYDISIWVDANLSIKADLNEFLGELDTLSDNCIWIPQHPCRDCAYEEANIVFSIGKDKSDKPKIQSEKYKKEGFPAHFGLTQNSIIVRKHNDKTCIKLMEMWWNEILNYSHRDQLSLQYCRWKSGINVIKLDRNTNNSKYFEFIRHQRVKKKVKNEKRIENKKKLNNPLAHI